MELMGQSVLTDIPLMRSISVSHIFKILMNMKPLKSSDNSSKYIAARFMLHALW